jgi:hypothetical protein
MDEPWPIRGLARELGVAWGWVSHRMRHGLLREPEVSRRPPHGHGLIREDAAGVTRLRVEGTRSRRWRQHAAPPSIPPAPGESLGPAVAGVWCGDWCHDSETKADIEGGKSRRVRGRACIRRSNSGANRPSGGIWRGTPSQRWAATCTVQKAGSPHGKHATRRMIRQGHRD